MQRGRRSDRSPAQRAKSLLGITLVLAAVAAMVCLVAAPQAAADTIAWR